MPVATVNAMFVTPQEWQEAARGMTNLVDVKVLPAWSGTPKTLRLKDDRGRYAARMEPDRAITQLYIPGLDPSVTRTAA